MKLRTHQVPHVEAILRALRDHRAAIDSSDTGTGKTFCALAVAKALGLVPFVLAPKSVIPAWERAANAAGTDIEVINYEKVRGTRKKGEPARSDWGYEQPWGKGSFWKWNTNVSLAIFDEVHECQGSTSRNSKLLIAAKRQFDNVLMLSATAAESPEHLKAIGFALGLHDLKNYQNWSMRFGVVPDWTGRLAWTTDEEEQKNFMAMLNAEIYPSRGARMRKSEIEGFPKTQILPFPVAATKADQQKVARICELQKMRGIQKDEAGSALEEQIRLRQELELAKIPAVVEAVVNSVAAKSKAVVFCSFRDTVELLVEQLKNEGLKVAVIWGDQELTERDEIVQAFQRNELDALVAIDKAGSQSISLHDPVHQVPRDTYLFPQWSGRVLVQTLGRVVRDGGGFSNQYLTFAEGTEEERIVERCLQKSKNIETINDGDIYG